jgi:hypothetical protein
MLLHQVLLPDDAVEASNEDESRRRRWGTRSTGG